MTEPLVPKEVKRKKSPEPLPKVKKAQEISEPPQAFTERTQRFHANEPKNEFAMRQHHDDVPIEEPTFIQMPSDQGLIAPVDETIPYEPGKLDVEEKADLDVVPKTKQPINATSVQVGVIMAALQIVGESNHKNLSFHF